MKNNFVYDDAIKILNKDAKMKKIVKLVGPCTIRTIPDPFEAIVDGIITQHLPDFVGCLEINFPNPRK
jgi:3-methyladenine DNA glycosylase/8-oxoguanine DNA glycosylase